MAPVKNVVHNPQHFANIANEVGRKQGLTCRYEWDSKRGRFMYRFFRRGMFLGAVGDARRVVAKMERYATAN